MAAKHSKTTDPTDLQYEDYTIAWIAPLEIEYQAACYMLDEEHEGSFRSGRGDDYVYTAGEINGHNIVIATFPAGHDYGVGSAAALASQVKKSFPNLWFGLLVGVAAGLPDLSREPARDIRLGDVLVGLGEGGSAGLVNYGLGKETADGFHLLHPGMETKTETVVRAVIGKIRAEFPRKGNTFLKYFTQMKDKRHHTGDFCDPGQGNDHLFDTRTGNDGNGTKMVERPLRTGEKRTQVWYGSIGSGDKLMRNARLRDRLRDEFNLIGLEMEAAGIINTIAVGVIRGVCDYGDEQKNKLWQPYAAAMAAAYASDILHRISPRENRRTERLETLSAYRDGSTVTASENRVFFTYPSRRVTYFVERSMPILRINQCFEKGKDFAAPAVFVLMGLGGCGKSQLALQFCRKAEKNDTYSAIFWIDATSPITTQQSITAVAQALSKPEFDIMDDDGNLQFVQNAMRGYKGRWLFVFDNFDNPISFTNKNLNDYFPPGSGSILVTSRHEAAKSLGDHLEVSKLSAEEASDLLFHRSRVQKNDKTVPEVEKIVRRLGFHALAIDQAGAYISARNLDIAFYLKHFNERRKKVLSETPDQWDYKRRLGDNEQAETKLTVSTTWELSFQFLKGDDIIRKDKEHILTLIAFFDSKDMSDALFIPYSREKTDWMVSCTQDDVWDIYEFQDILKELRDLSLLQSLEIKSTGSVFSLHPLVQDWIQLRISPESRQSYTTEALLVFHALLDDQDIDTMDFATKQALFTQLNAILMNKQKYQISEESLANPDVIRALSQFAVFLERQGKYEAAEPLYQQVLALRKTVLGPEHPKTLTSMNNLAHLYNEQGKYEAAQPLSQQGLALCTTVLGPEHPETITSMNNLAVLYESQGKYKAAEPLYQQALALCTTALGPEHPDTLLTMNNLASLYESQGKYKAAEPLYQQALALRTTVLGPEHPNTLTSMNNLAYLYSAQGNYKAAEPLYQQGLALCTAVLGPEHPDTLTSVNNLAGFYEREGKYEIAETLYQQTLALRKTVLGPEHPNTLTSMNNLGFLYKVQGNYEAAEPLYLQGLALCTKVLGPEHPDTLISVNNLALLYESLGKYEAAEPLYQQVLALRTTVLGSEHPDTLASIYNLADLYRVQNNPTAAEDLFRYELDQCKIVHGPYSRQTKESLKNLAGFLEELGKHEEAKEIQQQLTIALDHR